jgi:serine-type D-Ala-D-Ala carboxypeptidase/endopeptidase (penicillin-binding protein 4)
MPGWMSSFLGLLIVAGSATAAPAADLGAEARAVVRAQIDDLLGRTALKDAKVGVYITRLEDGAEIYAKDADTLFIPASNVKILTTAAALYHLSPDFRFKTELAGEIGADGVVKGDLFIKGYGDPGLVPERLWYMASRLYFQGARLIPGDIIIDDTYFAGPPLQVGWEQDESSSAYMAPAGAFSAGFNALMIHVLPGLTANSDARVLIDPLSDYAKVEGTVNTIARGRTNLTVEVEPFEDRSVVKVSGKISLKDEGQGFYRRIDNPALFAGEVLKRLLIQQGVAVKGKVKIGLVPTDEKMLVTLESPRLAELLLRVNKNSSNFVAQQVAQTMGAELYGAPGTWEKGKLAIEAFLASAVGIPRGSYMVANASGLHDVNRASPRQLVRVLTYMHSRPDLWPEFAASFAVAGGSGTLAPRMRDTEAAHLLRAKTGTLAIASALTGFVPAKSGETFVFSIIVNDYTTSVHDIWQAQDALGDLLASTRFLATPPPATASSAKPLGDVRP